MLPCGRRKDIKKSLRTRDKLVARDKVAQLLACARSRVKPETVQPEPQPSSLLEPQRLQQETPSAANPAPQSAPVGSSFIASPVLSELSDRYLKEKALSWHPKNSATRRTTSVTSSSRWGIDLPRHTARPMWLSSRTNC